MANRTVVVDLLVRTGQFTSGMQRASNDMASATTNMQTKVRALQMQVGLLGLGMTAFAVSAVKKWADFDQAMARVSATGGEAAARIDELNEAAKSDEVIQLGYNATEASDAIYELTKAGVSATDILGGGMAGALSLAAAESMDAADAASIMASALTQFNLEGTQAAHVADLLTAGAGKAQGSAHDLGLALKQSGLVADQFGLSIEQTTGTLAFFASAGLIGSDAGTSLRTMLLHLAGPSTKAANLMKEIGLEVYGANGKMVDMETLANNLQKSLGPLTEAQRNQALATIFGADATRAASLLYREGGEAVAEWTDKVNDAGYAQEVARKRMDNLNGDLKKMSATWDRTLIEMGQSADGPLRKLVQSVTDIIDRFGDLNPAIQGVILALVGGGGLAVLATLAIVQVVNALKALKAGLIAVGVTSEATAAKVSRALGTGAGIAGVAILATAAIGKLVDMMTNLWDGGGKAVKGVEDTTKALLDLNDAASKGSIDDLFNFGEKNIFGKETSESVKSLNDALNALTGDGAREKMNRWAANLDSLTGFTFIASVDDSKKAFDSLDQSITQLYSQSPELAQKAFQQLADGMDKTKYSTDDLMALLPGYSSALQRTANDATIAAQATDQNAGAMDGLGDSTAAVTAEEVQAQKEHEKYIDSIVESFTAFSNLGDVYQNIIDKQTEQAQGSKDASDKTKSALADIASGAKVSAKEYIKELEKQVKAQEKWADNLVALTTRVKSDMPPKLQDAAQEMIEELRGLGPAGAAQIELLKGMSDKELEKVVSLYARQGAAAGAAWADEVNSAETPEVTVDTAAATLRLSAVQDALNKINGQQASASVVIKTFMDKITGGQQYAPGVSKAGGGDVTGPGTGTSDSIPAMLSNGEHVLTASDVKKAGGQGAIYRLRAGIQSGMMHFASGGAVYKGHSLEYWEQKRASALEITQMRIAVRDSIRSLNEREKDGKHKGEYVLRGLDHKEAWQKLQEEKKELADALYANSLNKSKKGTIAHRIAEQERAKKKADAQKEAAADRAKNIASERTDFQRGARRGTGTASAFGSRDADGNFTGSADSAYSEIDRIRDNVLPNLTGKAKANLSKELAEAEKQTAKLYKGLTAVDKALQTATDKAAELKDVSDGVKNALVGGFSLADAAQQDAAVTGTVNPFTGETTGGSPLSASGQGQKMLAAAQAYATKVKTFAGKLKALADKGFAGVILQEVAAMGVEAGIPAADALLALNATDTKAMNQAYTDIATFSGAAGQAVTEGFYEGGLKAADGIVAGLKAKEKDIQDAIMKMGLDMQAALKAALGIKSPSRKFRAIMKFVGDGIALGLDDQKGTVADASARLFSGVTVPGGSALYGGTGGNLGSNGELTAMLSNEQVERLAVAFETGNVRNINAATAQKNRKTELTYGSRGR